MTKPPVESPSPRVEAFLSGAYPRIRRTTMALGIVGTMATALWFGWRRGLGLAAGAAVGYVNLVWLYHTSALMTQRMIAPAENPPSKLRLVLGFAGRYAFVMLTAYVILKSWPGILASFTVALFFPIIAAMGEGIYEAFASGKTSSAD